MAITKIPKTMIIAASHAIGAIVQPAIPKIIPRITQQHRGPQKENVPLQAIPNGAPHIALPLYQNMNAPYAPKPARMKYGMD